MGLCEEISVFLTGRGLSPRISAGNVISVSCPKSGTEKSVIPIEFKESTFLKDYQEIIQEHAQRTGHSPIIVPEDRWRRQPEMMRKRILAHLEMFHSVYARNCEIRRIDKTEAAAFLEENHSYGDASCKYRYGMFLKRYTGHTTDQEMPANEDADGSPLLAPGTLVAVSEFSNARKWRKGDKTVRSYEWTRYASLAGIRLTGGMGRMLRHFIDEVAPDDIMSYADLEWSDGSAYSKLGFLKESTKEAVSFRIVPATWERIPIRASQTSSPASSGLIQEEDAPLIYQNLGSLKYRLKLTEY